MAFEDTKNGLMFKRRPRITALAIAAKAYDWPTGANLVTSVFQIFLTVLIILNRKKIEFAHAFLWFHVIVVLLLQIVVIFDDLALLRWFKAWNPTIIVPLNFKELAFLVHIVNPTDYDAQLAHLDSLLFGCQPTIWLERFTVPFITEILQIIYTSFFFLPIILAFRLYHKAQSDRFNHLMFAGTLCFYLSYVLYFLVPALGPRFYLADTYTNPLNGLGLAPILHNTLNQLEGFQRDAFPSGHTAVMLLTIHYARVWDRAAYPWFMVIGSLLIFSTVYLRYHYVVDVIAGVILAYVVIYLADYLHARFFAPDKP